jgi:hypothetical protein
MGSLSAQWQRPVVVFVTPGRTAHHCGRHCGHFGLLPLVHREKALPPYFAAGKPARRAP